MSVHFLLVISLFKMAPQCSVEVLSHVSKHRKAPVCLTEKICLLGKLHSSMSYNVGPEFSDVESNIFI